MQCMIENRGLFMENNIKEESRLKFQFAENDIVIKFDDTTHTSVNVEGRDSLDIEVAQKTAMTLAALVGAKSFRNTKECLNELREYIQFLSEDSFSNDSKKKYVILFLEGDFGTRTRTKKMIMKELQDSMNKKLRWIDCRVSVVDSDTYDPRIFRIVS